MQKSEGKQLCHGPWQTEYSSSYKLN